MQLQEERVGGKLKEQIVSYNEIVKNLPMEVDVLWRYLNFGMILFFFLM